MSDSTKGVVQYDASAALMLSGQAQAALTSATDLVIDSPTMYELASDELRNIKTLQKTVEDRRTSITGPLNQAVKAVNDLFRAPKDFLDKAEAACKRSMIAYTTEQERIAAEQRREAERLAAVERERLAAEQRAQEQAAREAAAAAQQAQRDAEAAAAAGDAEAAAAAQEQARQHAAAAEAATAEAQATETTAAVICMPIAAPAPAKVAGIAGRVTYSAQVDDLMALVKAAAAGTAPIQCLCADEKFLGAQARAFKKAGSLFPGVSAIAERGIAARAA